MLKVLAGPYHLTKKRGYIGPNKILGHITMKIQILV
jgi:hypothetical protein